MARTRQKSRTGVAHTRPVVAPGRRRRARALPGALAVASAVLTLVQTAYSQARGDRCFERLSAGRPPLELRWGQRGSSVERREIPPAWRGRPLLVRVEKNDVEVGVQALDGAGTSIAQSDSPLERSGAEYLYLPVSAGPITLVMTADEPARLNGSVRVTFLSDKGIAAGAGSPDCDAALQQWAAADMAYAHGRSITLGLVSADAGAAHAAFETAAKAYTGALQELTGPAYASERGQLELALAALSYYGLKDWSGSARWAHTAAATFADTHENYRRARAQAIEASAWIELATRSAGGGQSAATPSPARIQLSAARALLVRLSEFHASRREDYDRALQINNIGLAYLYEARFEPAIPYFSQAQREFERLGDAIRTAVALQNIALCDWGLGRLSAALTKFDRALELMPATTRLNVYLITLNNSGLAHYAAGGFDESLRLQTQALDLATRLQSETARARSEYGLGVTYYAIGERELAADFLRRGLGISTAEVDARTRVALLRALAQIEYERGHLAAATGHDSEALRLASASSARARILLRLAADYAAQGDAAASRQILDELIAHPPNHDELVHAMARVQRGRLLHAAGANQLAEEDLTAGIQTLDRFDALAERFEARVELARVYADRGRIEEALAVLRRALLYSREIRGQTANPEYRASIVRALRPALSLEVDLLHGEFTALLQQGRPAAARALAEESLAAVDQDRALGFQAWRAEYFEQHSNTELAHLLATSAALYRDMAERRYQLAVREDRGGTDDARARSLREDLARLRVRLGLTAAEIARRSGGVDDSSVYSSQKSAVPGSERALEPRQAVIVYWLGTSHAYAWVLRNTGIEWFELRATSDIDHAARALHAAMHSTATVVARREACLELYRLAFAPLVRALGGAEDLIFIPDGSLHYVPFDALRDPEENDHAWLVQTFDLSIAPSLRFLPKHAAASRSPAAPADASRVLIVADPIYAADDPRLAGAGKSTTQAHAVREDQPLRDAPDLSGLVRLESSAREASQIGALFGADRVDLLHGAGATRDAVLARDLGRYRFIHIASHGVIDSEIPQLSALILGRYGSGGPVADPYLRAGDLLTRTFHAEAVVLSACDTALGKEYASEGLVGLRYAALARGAHAVVASLWPVSDAIAARLMTGMYRGIIASDETRRGSTAADGRQVAHALAAAMREELLRAPALDPALWAPFTVYVAGD
jgi:CHAT domain-containing protein